MKKQLFILTCLLLVSACARVERMESENRDPANWVGRNWKNYNAFPGEGKCRLFVDGIVTCNHPDRIVKFYVDKDGKIESLEYIPQ